jgi:hypothetical protein
LTTSTLARPAIPHRSDYPVSGTAFAAALFVASAVAAFGAHIGVVVSVAYPAAAVLIAVTLLRRDRSAYLVFVLWMWLLTPEVRRLTDYASGWNPNDSIMTAPGLATLVAVVPLLRQRYKGRMANAALLASAAVCYGFAVGMLLAGPAAALSGLLYWLPPPILGLLMLGPSIDQRSLRVAINHVCVWGALITGLYGILQFLWLPAWDAQWMVNSAMTTIGSPIAQQVRVFSTLNSPGPFGMTMAALLVGLAGSRSRLRMPAITLGGVALGLSLVRSGWVGFAFGILALLILGGSGNGRKVGIVLAFVPIVAITLFGGTVTQTISHRFQNTTQAAASDDSLTARIQFHEKMVPRALSNPVGEGIGSTGVASTLAVGDAQSSVSFDGAIPESLFALGGLVGAAYLAALTAAVAFALRTARSHASSAPPAAAAFALAMQAFFGNPFVSVGGVFLFAFLATAVRPVVIQKIIPNAPSSTGMES